MGAPSPLGGCYVATIHMQHLTLATAYFYTLSPLVLQKRHHTAQIPAEFQGLGLGVGEGKKKGG